ncbi:MAG: hypothetical protein GY786_24935 [Proteobacteria bacterium]|nr:hypothetical protein [Pseudomonadota bacterium]
MRRTTLLLISISSFFLSYVPLEAEELKRIIMLETMQIKVIMDHTHWFRIQMEELGYREGQNLNLIVLNGSGDPHHTEALLRAAITKKRPDLVVTSATMASKIGLKLLKNSGIPQLFLTVSDPVGAGLVRKIGEPTGKNITGRVHTISRKTKIRIALSLVNDKIKNKPIRFGILHSSYPSSVGDVALLQEIASDNKNISFVPYKIKYRSISENLDIMLVDVKKGLRFLEGRIDYLWEASGPLAEVEDYNRTLHSLKSTPVIYGVTPESVQLGALLYLLPDAERTGREVAVLADAILKGGSVGSMPVVPPFKFRMGINLTTAVNMNIVIPPNLLKLAEGNLYY